MKKLAVSRATASSFFLIGLPVLFLLFFSTAPTLLFLSRSFFDPGPTTKNIALFFEDDVYIWQFYNTIKIAVTVTLLTILAAYPLATYIASLGPRVRTIALTVVAFPFWTSILIRTFAWLLVLADTGPINQVLLGYGLVADSVKFIGSSFGTLVGMIYVQIPYATLVIYASVSVIDRRLSQAAWTMGARPWQAFLRVFLPLSLPGVISASLLVFIESLGFYITPSLLGGVGQSMIAQSIAEQITLLMDWSFGAFLALLLLALSLAIYIVYGMFVGIDGIWGTFAGGETKTLVPSTKTKRAAPRFAALSDLTTGFRRFVFKIAGDSRLMLDGAPAVAKVLAWLVMAFLVLPLAVIIAESFTSLTYLSFPPRGFSFRWYQELLTQPLWIGAFWNSLVVGLLSALLSAFFGVLTAFGMRRLASRSRIVLSLLVLSPLIIPRILISVAALYFFARFGAAGSMTSLVLVHATLGVPFVVISLGAMLSSFDHRLEQAAGTLGASPLRVFFKITMPLIAPALIAGSMFAFITSFDDLVIALFNTQGSFKTLPKAMWEDIQLNVRPTLAAAGSILLFATGLLIAASYWFRSNRAASR